MYHTTKMQKLKRRYYTALHRHSGDVLQSNITFLFFCSFYLCDICTVDLTRHCIDDKNIDLRIKNIKNMFFPFNKKKHEKNIPKNIPRKFTVNIQCGQCCPVSDY